jgi:hypothetical protein
MLKKFDWKYSSIAIILIIGFVLSHIFYNHILYYIKCFFYIPELNVYAGAIAIIFTILHKIKGRKINFDADMSFKDFRASIGDIISFVDNPIILVGSFALAKGLYLQYFDNTIYFPFLKGYELTFILLVTLYLLFISLMELWKNIKETCFDKPIESQRPLATPEIEITNRVVPRPEEL